MNNNELPSITPLYITISVLAGLSTFLSLALFIFCCLTKGKKSFIFFLVINMLISNLIHVISYIMNWVDNNKLIYNSLHLCLSQSVLMIFSSMSQEFWVTSISIIVLFTIKRNADYLEINRTKFYILFWILFDLLPFIATMGFRFGNLLGQNSIYCWFNKESVATIWIVYGIRWISIIICLIFTILILKFTISLKYEEQTEEIQVIQKFGRKMIAYPIIQLIGAVIPTVNRLYLLFEDPNITLQKAAIICGAVQGILFPISYGWNSGMFSFVVRRCKNIQENQLKGENWDDDEIESQTINMNELFE